MSLQDVYYLTNIISTILGICLLLILIILVFVIMRKFSQLSDNLNRRIDQAGQIMEDPSEYGSEFIASTVSKSIRKVKQTIQGLT